MSESVRDIPEEMVRKGAVPVWGSTEQDAMKVSRMVLSAALAGRQVVDLPAESVDEVDILSTEFEVSILPRDDINRSSWTITVSYRGRDRYAVRNGPFCLSRTTGDWDYEARPSDREDEWLDDHRFTRDEALRLAVEKAPHVVTNGRTATEVLQLIRDREAAAGSGSGED